MPTGVLSVKLGSCVTMPSKRFYVLLDGIAQDCNRIRNAVARGWLRWREDNPDWEPAQRRVRDGSPKVKADGTPVLEHPMISQDVEKGLFHVYKTVAPRVSSNLASGCWSEVLGDLKDRVPYNHDGPSRFRWQAVLNSEVQLSTYRGLVLPCAKKDSVIVATDDELTLEFPVLSKASGFKVIRHKVRLVGHKSHGLSKGNQRLLQRIARGDVKRCDSTITKKDKDWYLRLVYDVPVTNHHLDPGKVATITPLRDNRRPFEVKTVNGGRWLVGDGVAMKAACDRINMRRKAIRHRYRDGAGSGHGKRQFFRALRPLSRAVIDEQDRFVKSLAAEIVKFCVQNDCGSVIYREPTMPLRKLLWFDTHGVPFDWTKFASFLAFKLQCHGIAQEYRNDRKKQPVRIGVAEHKEEYPWSWK